MAGFSARVGGRRPPHEGQNPRASWDPVEGPCRTNDYTFLDVPICFDMETWPTDLDPVYGGHRSCAQTGWAGWTTDDLFAGYDWLGKDG